MRARKSVPDIFQGQRVGVFMDIQSLYFACKNEHGPDAIVDFSPCLEWVVGDRILTRAVAYIRYYKESETHSFHQALNIKGIEVKSKPAKDFKDRRLTWTVGMMSDILRANSKMDLAIVLTHDEEFTDALPYLESQGIPVEIWGFRTSLSSCLKQGASKFLFIPDHVVNNRESKGEGSVNDD